MWVASLIYSSFNGGTLFISWVQVLTPSWGIPIWSRFLPASIRSFGIFEGSGVLDDSPLVNHQVKVFIRYFLDMPPLPPWNRGNNKECRDRSQKGVLQAVSSLIFSHFPFLCHLSYSNNFAPSRASNKRLNSPDSRTIDENFEFSMVGGRYTGPNGEKMICVP